MSDIIFQIYGTFLLTLLGFVLPVLTIALSLFPDGVRVLTQKYDNEKKQAETNLTEELKKKPDGELNTSELTKNIRILKAAKRHARRRLTYLNPSNIVTRSFIAISASLVSFMFALYFGDNDIYIPWTNTDLALVPTMLTLAFLVWTLWIFYNAMESIVEASSEVQNIRQRSEERTLELLTAIADKKEPGVESLFIKHGDIRVSFDHERLEEGKEYVFSANKEHKVDVSLTNSSEYMLKTAELGFKFPPEFLIKENADLFSIYAGKKENILRFEHEHLQSHENMNEGQIPITFLKTGTFPVNAFVKGENLKQKSYNFNIRVID